MAQTHSKYKKLEVVLTNGEIIVTRSTYPGEKMTLEIDRYTHPAWQKNKNNFINAAASSVSKFRQSYGGAINFTKISNTKEEEK
jgi:ribosomal protein L31